MIRCIFAAALFAFVCIACNKSDPEKHPEYLGTWVSTDYSSNPCDYVITIATKENSTYAIAGSGCAMSTSVNGTCSIRSKSIYIGEQRYTIVLTPQSISSQLATHSMDNVQTSGIMTLSFGFPGQDYTFYKVN